MQHWLVTYPGWDVQEQCEYTHETLFSVYSKAVKYALRCEDDGEDEVSIKQVSVDVEIPF